MQSNEDELAPDLWLFDARNRDARVATQGQPKQASWKGMKGRVKMPSVNNE
jgi:hypothetical protein